MRKTFKFFMCAAIVAAGFTACSGEENTPEAKQETKEATLVVNFKGTADPTTKAFDGATTGVELEDAMLFIVGSDGNSILNYYYAGNTALGDEWLTTTDGKYVIVLGNTGNQTATFAAATTLTKLKEVMWELNGMMATNAKILLHGQSPDLTWVDGAASDGTSPLAQTDVTVYPVPARMDVTIANNMTTTATGTPAPVFANYIKFEGVTVLYSAKKNYVVPTTGADRTVAADYNYTPAKSVLAPNAADKYFFSGIAVPTSANAWGGQGTTDIATGAALGYLNKTWASHGPGTTFTETFYALPGENPTNDSYTTIAVYGWFDKDGGRKWPATWTATPTGAQTAERRYWYVTLSPTDAKEVLANGTQYNIGITLTGDFTNGGGSTTNPDDEVVPGYVLLTTITSNKWDTQVDINKEIK